MVDYFYKKLTPRLGYGNVLLQYQDTGEHSPPLFYQALLGNYLLLAFIKKPDEAGATNRDGECLV